MTTAVIAHHTNGRYARPKFMRPEAVVMGDNERADQPDQDRAELERLVRAGEWLKTGRVAKLLGIGRTKVHKLVESGVIGHRKVPGGVQRLCNPVDVLRLLEEGRTEQRGKEAPPP